MGIYKNSKMMTH